MRIVVEDNVFLSSGESIEPNDNFMVESDISTVGLSGIVLNTDSLSQDEIVNNITGGGTQKLYKGCYVMWYYDKKNKVIYIANDLLSKKSVYYYAKDGLILVNTSLFDLCSDMRTYSIMPEINMAAVEYFCLENVFYGDVTYVKDTFFLTAYSYLVIDCKRKELMVKQLPIPNMQKESSLTFDDATKKLEMLFSEGCELQWEKNRVYGKDQIMTLSGGMDSRAMLLHLIRKEGADSIHTYTYAQSGSNDSRIARKLADKLHIANTFIPLDECEFAFKRDEIINANEGQMFYIGSTGAILMGKMVKEKHNPGIVHTGLGGGEILGDMCVAGGDEHDIEDVATINQRRNLDDIRRCLNFQKTTSRCFAAFSPFLYEDFFEYALTIPASMRMHRKLYIKWYKQYMHSNFPSVGSHSLVAKGINRVLIKLYKIIGKRNPADMNPIQYWYDTNSELRDYIDKTWTNDSAMLKEQGELLRLLEQFFEQNVVKKFAVLTVTGSVIRILGLVE